MDKKIEIYTSPTCHYCTEMKEFLNGKSVAYTEYDVMADEEKRKELTERSKQLGVPVMFVDGTEMIVGFDKQKITETLGLTE